MAFVGSGLVARRDCQRVGKKRDEGWCSRRERVRAAMIGDDVKDDQVVKFKTTEDKKSLNLLGAQETGRPKTRGELILEQIEETKRKLGVEERELPPPPVRKEVDLSTINVLYGFGSAAFTLAMCYGLFTFTAFLIDFYNSNPFTSDIYALNRIYAVVRTAMVTIFSLATGIVGVTGLGILGLSCQVSYLRLTGKLPPK